jgi:hypothetical protein
MADILDLLDMFSFVIRHPLQSFLICIGILMLMGSLGFFDI